MDYLKLFNTTANQEAYESSLGYFEPYVGCLSDGSNVRYNQIIHYGEGNPMYVDLGLPSGTLWATCNLGAHFPTETGNYYGGGELSPKENYSGSYYRFGDGYDSSSNITKYNSTDSKVKLDYVDDVATVEYGVSDVNDGKGRIPTDAQMQELVNQCTKTKVTINGVTGMQFTKNNKSIFLPMCGYKTGSNTSNSTYGYYGSSIVYDDGNAKDMILRSENNIVIDSDHKYKGLLIRPVLAAPDTMDEGYILLWSGYASRDSSVVSSKIINITRTYADAKIKVGDTGYTGDISTYSGGGGQAAYIDQGYYISPSIYKEFYRDKNQQSFSGFGDKHQWLTNIPTSSTFIQIFVKP